MDLEFLGEIFEKFSNIMTIRANKRTDKRVEGWADMKKLVIALRNFANALINTSQLLINYKNPLFRIEVLYNGALAFYCIY